MKFVGLVVKTPVPAEKPKRGGKPKVETPKTEEPKVETPKAEEPKDKEN